MGLTASGVWCRISVLRCQGTSSHTDALASARKRTFPARLAPLAGCCGRARTWLPETLTLGGPSFHCVPRRPQPLHRSAERHGYRPTMIAYAKPALARSCVFLARTCYCTKELAP